MTKRLLIMAGGTGGHVFPGLAVAKHLQKQGWEILWLGTAERLEARLVPEAGFDIRFIKVQGLRGNGILRMLKAPFVVLNAIFQARAVIKSFRPDVVLGMGGYASGPGGIASWLSGVPLILHEQNAAPGMTNRILAAFASRILTGFDNTFSGKNNVSWVGNPVREDFVDSVARDKPHSPVRLLVVGGSLGAKVLNEEVPNALRGLSGIEVRHQCGAGNKTHVSDYFRETLNDQMQWCVEEFIDDMAGAYQWADVVVCRAGALTVAEVAASGVAAIFVPLPHAVDDHQTKNARSLADNSAGWLVPQNTIKDGGLRAILEIILKEPNQLIAMGTNARKLAKLDATQKVAEDCQLLAGKAA